MTPSPLDQQWQRLFGEAELSASACIAADSPVEIHLATALALWAPLHGDTCVDLERVPSLVASRLAQGAVSDTTDDSPVPDLVWPALDMWQAALMNSPLVRVVSGVDDQPVYDQHPLVMCGSLVYTQRQWIDECIVATRLLGRLSPHADATTVLSPPLQVLARALFPDTDQAQQLQAAIGVLGNRLSVILGGPGTGKTYTVARMLALAVADAAERGQQLRIALAAPTGKAASRMTEAVHSALSGDLANADTGGALAALAATTVHRLLGRRPTSDTRFRHDSVHPLPFDVVVIDETSMLSLPMMARLLEALRPEAHLVLVGDPDQLESVEVGAVLADLATAAASDPRLAAVVTRLETSYRQGKQSKIPQLAAAIRTNRADDVVDLLCAGDELVSMVDIDSFDAVRAVVMPLFEQARASALRGEAAEALTTLATVRVLCAHRRGRYGAQTWNKRVEQWLMGSVPTSRQYSGRPLLIRRNDDRLRLSNGDTGVIVKTPAGQRAAFAERNGVRLMSPVQLEAVDTAYAMTIHKSQGSEYDTVVLVLPDETSPLIGRELLYTAVTRSSRRLVVVGSAASIRACVGAPATRSSGLVRTLCQSTVPIDPIDPIETVETVETIETIGGPGQLRFDL